MRRGIYPYVREHPMKSNANPIPEVLLFFLHAAIIVLIVAFLSGCGVTVNHTHYYTVMGAGNKITNTTRTDSRPDITATTTATVPVSALP